MKKFFLLATVLLLVGCGRCCDVETVNSGPTSVTTVTTTPTESTIQLIVDQQNQQRAVLGYPPLTPGLSCNLYTVPTSTSSIASASLTSVASFGYDGVFNEPNSVTSTGLNVLPIALQSVYQNWFVVKCYGSLVVDDNNWHQFSLGSDDGSNLYVDGLLINNDGLHSALTKTNTTFLAYGVHSFEIDFFQGQGYQELVLDEDGQVMNSNGFYH